MELSASESRGKSAIGASSPLSNRMVYHRDLPFARLPLTADKSKRTTNRVSRLDPARHPLKAAMAAP